MSSFRLLTVVCASASALLLTTAAGAAPSSTTLVTITDQGAEPLTLTGAKRLVDQRLIAIGKSALRAGRASFDSDGNVSVEVVTSQGISVGHVKVDAKSGQVTNAKTGAPLAMNG